MDAAYGSGKRRCSDAFDGLPYASVIAVHECDGPGYAVNDEQRDVRSKRRFSTALTTNGTTHEQNGPELSGDGL